MNKQPLVSVIIPFYNSEKFIDESIESKQFNLIEKIAGDIMNIVFSNNRINRTTVKVDKPGALRFADSVSVEITQER